MHKPHANKKSYNDVLTNSQHYMFTQKNLSHFLFTLTKSKMTQTFSFDTDTKTKDKHEIQKEMNKVANKEKNANKHLYKPKQKDTLFWCFYILKYGISNYEMEIGNQHFVVEKKEKIKYVETIRTKKETLKLHKIKPISEVEYDLANNEQISIKSFFSLCVIENINAIIIDKRKKYEVICNDEPKVFVIHKNEVNQYSIQFDATPDQLQNYRDNYYSVEGGFETKLKAMGSYKLDELIELCRKLDITIPEKNSEGKKMGKKDIYELLVMNF
jgi:hypothetical protein